MPLKVQLPLPIIGLELYHQGVHIRAKKKTRKSFYTRVLRFSFSFTSRPDLKENDLDIFRSNFAFFILLQCDQICAKFHNFVKILKYFGNFERVYLVFSIFNLLWQI